MEVYFMKQNNKLLIFLISLIFILSINFAFAVNDNVTDLSIDSADVNEDLDVPLQETESSDVLESDKYRIPLPKLSLRVRLLRGIWMG